MHKMNSRLFSIHTYTLNVKIVAISGRHEYFHILDTFLYFPFFYNILLLPIKTNILLKSLTNKGIYSLIRETETLNLGH